MFFPNNSQSMKFCRNSSNSPEYERWIPPTTISHATVCAKRQGRAQAGGPLPERGWRGRIWVDMRMYEEEAGCMRALKAFYKLGRTSMAFNSTRRVETFRPCRTRAWFNDYLTNGNKNIQRKNQMYKLLIAKYRPQLLRIKSEKRGLLALKRDEQTSRTWASIFERKVQSVIANIRNIQVFKVFQYSKYSSIQVFKYLSIQVFRGKCNV